MINSATLEEHKEETNIIHSNLNIPSRFSKHPTRLSLDHKNQMLIKGIYKLPSKISKNNTITIYQGSLSTIEKTLNSSAKILKTDETVRCTEKKYPYQISDIVKEKVVNVLSPKLCLNQKNAEKNEERMSNIVKKERFLSFDTKKINELMEQNKDKMFYLNTAYLQKKNWFNYPRNSALLKNRNSYKTNNNASSSKHNIAFSNNPANSLCSSPLKRKYDSIQKQRSSVQTQKSRSSFQKKRNSNSHSGKPQKQIESLPSNSKIARLFEQRFVETLNEMVSNPPEKQVEMNLDIKQVNLKNQNEVEKVLDFKENSKKELNQLLSDIQSKYEKILKEENIYREYQQANEDMNSFTRVGDNYITETEMQTLVSEFSLFDHKDVEIIDKITKRIKFFAKFSKPIRYRLLNISALIKKNSNEILFKQGDFGDFLYVIVKGSVNVIVNSRNKNGEYHENIVASLYDGSSFGELAMMGANRNTKELKIDLISQIITKSDIYKYLQRETEEKALDEKKKLLQEAIEINKRFHNKNKIIEKLENEIKEAIDIKIKEGQKRLATIKTQESSYFLVIPRNEFKSILLSLFQQDFEFKLKILKKIHFFKDCDSASLIPFASYLNIKKYKMGQVILREQEKIAEFFIVGKGRCKVAKEMVVERSIKPSDFMRRMNDPLKNFKFGLEEYNTDERNILRLSEKTNNYLEEEKEKIEKSLKLFQWQILEENEEVMKYLDLIEYKKLLEGDFFCGRGLLAFDPVLSKTIKNENAKLTVIADSNEVILFALPCNFINFVPDYIKKILIRNLAISKEFDEFQIHEDVKNFKVWTKIKQHKCQKIIEDMGKERVGDQFYKKY